MRRKTSRSVAYCPRSSRSMPKAIIGLLPPGVGNKDAASSSVQGSMRSVALRASVRRHEWHVEIHNSLMLLDLSSIPGRSHKVQLHVPISQPSCSPLDPQSSVERHTSTVL